MPIISHVLFRLFISKYIKTIFIMPELPVMPELPIMPVLSVPIY